MNVVMKKKQKAHLLCHGCSCREICYRGGKIQNEKKKQREKEVALIRVDVRILTKHHIVPHSEDTTA
jgi:hypothetical protein